MINFLIHSVLEAIYPSKCACCRDYCGQIICEKCQEELSFCNKTTNGVTAKAHAEFMSFSLFRYEGRARELIISLKFNNYRRVAREIASLAVGSEGFHDMLQMKNIDLITHVPASPDRLRNRGFDQSKALASEIGKMTRIRVRSAYVHEGGRPPQSSLSGPMRIENASGAYRIREPSLIKNRRMLLVDDILTTGATIAECVEIALTAGAECVCAFSAARTFLAE